MLQASGDLLKAAHKGQMQDVKALLLNGTDPEAKDNEVTFSSCICISGLDAAHILCETLVLIDTFSCSKCHILPHVAKHCSAHCCCNQIGNGCAPCGQTNCDAVSACDCMPAAGIHCIVLGCRSGCCSCR